MEEKQDYRKELFYEKKNGYDLMCAEERAGMERYCEGYKAYLNDSRTEREAVPTPSSWPRPRASRSTSAAWRSSRGRRSGTTTAARP